MAIHDTTLIDGQDASTSRSTLGLVLGTDVQIQNAILQAIADLSNSSGCLTNDGEGNLSWAAAAGGDFSDGGEVGGDARTLGNTDDYTLGLLSNNVSVITIDGDSAGSLIHIGEGSAVATPNDVVIHATDSQAGETNTAGASILYKAGLSTGNAQSAHVFYSSTESSPGTSLQAERVLMKLRSDGNDAVMLIGQEAIATDQDGYEIYMDNGNAGAKIGAKGSSAISYLHLHNNISLQTADVSNAATIGLAAGNGGANVTILGTYIGSGSTSPTAYLDVRTHAALRAAFRIRSSVAAKVTSPNDGDFWRSSTEAGAGMSFYDGTYTYRLDTEIKPDNIQTTDDTTTTIQAVAVATDTVASVKVWVTACLNDASDGMTFCLVGVFKNDSGTTSQIGATTSMATIGTAGWTVALAADDGTDSVDVNVTGAVATDVNWTARVEVETVADLS